MGEYGIDAHSEHSLYDILEKDLDPREDSGTEYYGFHVVPQGNGRYHVQYDGHAGTVHTFDREEYNDVLELVADLNDLLIRAQEYDYQNDKEGLVDWAGKIITDNKAKANQHPGLYMHVPQVRHDSTTSTSYSVE